MYQLCAAIDYLYLMLHYACKREINDQKKVKIKF